MSPSHTSTAALRQQVFAKHRTARRRAKAMPKSTTVAAYMGVFLLIISIVAIGYRPPQQTEAVASAATPATDNSLATDTPSVDQVVATNIAAGIAERANLPIATNVANLSVSLADKSALAQTDESVIAKPQIVQVTADGHDLKTYVTKAGDTAQSVAATYGISVDTVKWANNLSTDAISEGKTLTILPVDGVLYTTKAGDNVDQLASKYGADKNRIISFNNLELGGLNEGKQIIIPGGTLPTNERPGYVAPSTASSYGAYNGGYSTINAQIAGASAGNRYAFGNCTWYAYERRQQLGRPVGSFWGNAATWASYARAAGYRVDNTPEVGAVMQNGGGYGHVAVVESLNSDGSITISEMNYAGNFNRVTSRTVPTNSLGSFNYIH